MTHKCRYNVNCSYIHAILVFLVLRIRFLSFLKATSEVACQWPTAKSLSLSSTKYLATLSRAKPQQIACHILVVNK